MCLCNKNVHCKYKILKSSYTNFIQLITNKQNVPFKRSLRILIKNADQMFLYIFCENGNSELVKITLQQFLTFATFLNIIRKKSHIAFRSETFKIMQTMDYK